jgi:hypothetical protein
MVIYDEYIQTRISQSSLSWIPDNLPLWFLGWFIIKPNRRVLPIRVTLKVSSIDSVNMGGEFFSRSPTQFATKATLE